MKHIALTALIVFALQSPAKTYHLYFMGGQSNMVGFGSNSELNDRQHRPVPNTRIFMGQIRNDFQSAEGVGVWADLTPGFGAGFKTTNEETDRSNRFGPELAFAHRLRELRPDENIAIIKYAKGGSSIDDRFPRYGTWDPHDTRGSNETPPREHAGVNQYDHALATIRNATGSHDIDGDGEPDTLIPAGILWMQGETDAGTPETAADYDENLAELIELLRAAMRVDDLPFVMGRISDSRLQAGHENPQWKHGDTVRDNQAKVADADPMVTLITNTDTYGYSDPAHYNTAGYLDLGIQFAEAINALRPQD